MVEFLEKDLHPQGIGFAFIYCDHKSNQSQDTRYFLAAIVRQIVERRQVIPDIIYTLYEDHCGKGTSPTTTEYLHSLQSLAKDYSEVYIVIDALDECIDKTGQLIWSDLLTKLKDSVPNLRLLYTSRDIDDVAGILSKSSVIDVRASDEDLETYIREQLRTQNTLLQFCKQDPTLESKVLRRVVEKADGM